MLRWPACHQRINATGSDVHPSLRTLIERFRAAQDRAVTFIVGTLGSILGIRLPRNPADWVFMCGETGLYNARWVNGVEVYTHGYGIELTFPDLSIDFDWGEFGEPDGFDVWRLYNFAQCNPCEVPCPTHAEVREWIEAAIAAGELSQDRYLCYFSEHRVGEFLFRADEVTPTHVVEGDGNW